MYDGILSVIGNTPLIRLTQVYKDIDFRLFAKLEGFNPGGSTKDRPAAWIIRQGIDSGTIFPGVVIIESSSGNMGIGLAQICAYYGLRFICVVDTKTTAQNICLLQAYGAEVEVVSAPDPVTGELLQARIDRVQYLLGKFDHTFWPNQYANLSNPRAHHQTMHEIATALDGDVDYLFCATSTCGTLRGCVEYIREHHLKTKVIAVDAMGSVIFGGQAAKRLIPGHGAAVSPKLFHPNLADHFVHISDLECVVGCRRLVRSEAIMVGGSSGAVVTAMGQSRSFIEKDASCVGIFTDRGERYLDTVYSDRWVTEHFGQVSYMWETTETETCELATY
jgi:2,3-diaminopropionate biosynthesis protein SbnA